jgi:hypothetical protein
VREGSSSFALYVIDSWDIVICQEGREIRKLGAGDSLGENSLQARLAGS